MPVTKYKSFEDASKSLMVPEPDAKYFDNLKALFDFWGRLNKIEVLRGIRKIKSFDKLNEIKSSNYNIHV